MNRTLAFLVVACALGLVALVLKVPGPAENQPASAPTTPPPAQQQLPSTSGPGPVQKKTYPVGKPGSLSLSGKLSHPYIVPGTSDVFATLEVRAVEVPGAQRAPVNMALVIDRSGSMAGVKLANAKRAARELLGRLDARDSLAIVHYGTDVKSLPTMKVTDQNRERMRRYIERIIDDGGTNIGAGLWQGQQQLTTGEASCEGCIRRLVLLSDGQPTEGIQSVRGLTQVVAKMHAQGISVTALGIGYDFNEDLMTQLASVGGGSYGYLKDSAALAAIIQQDLQRAGTLVARDVSLHVNSPSDIQFREVLGREANTARSGWWVKLPDFSAGQVEKLVVRFTAQAGLTNGAALDIADFSLSYRDALADQAADSKLKLAAMVTGDRSLADARRDPEAVVIATRARAAVNYKKAADAGASGRFEEARRAVETNTALFHEAEQLAGPKAVEEDKADNAQAFGLIQGSTAGGAPQLDAVKSMKAQSQRASGAGGSLYYAR